MDEPSLDEVVADAFRRIAAAMEREERSGLKRASVLNGNRFTVTCKPERPKRCQACADLPEAVSALSKATHRVYRKLRELRSKPGGDERAIWQQDICEAIRKESPKDDLSIRTVYRALKQLCTKQVVRKDPAVGFLLGGQQPTLPFCE